MNIDDLKVTVNVAGADQFVRFMDRLEKIANRAPADVKKEIECAVELLLAELSAGRPSGQPGQRHYPDYDTKAAP